MGVIEYSYGVHRLAAVDGFGERLVDAFAHLLRGDGLLAGLLAAGYVRGAVAGVENFVDGLLYGAGVLLEIGGVAENHGGGEDRAERVGLAGSRDVGALPWTGS